MATKLRNDSGVLPLGNGLGVNRAISAKLEISATIERCLHRQWRTWRQRTSGVSNPRSVPIVTHVESATQHIIFCPFYTFRCPGTAASVAGTTRVTSADILHLFPIVSKELDKMPICHVSETTVSHIPLPRGPPRIAIDG